MADVARAAGVSVMSVSRALRGVGKVGPATVERIRQTARDLGYQPNAMVQTLMANVRRGHAQQRSNLAWIKTHRGEPPIAVRRIEASARRRAQELGYELENIYLPPAELNAAAIQRMLLARGICGVIIGPLPQPGTIVNFPWDRFPIATVGRSLQRPSLHYTMSHYHHAMARLLDELTARGYRKISYLKSRLTTDRSEQTSTMVFEHHCLKLGFAPSETIREIGDWRTFDFRSWWEDSRPDAIVGDYSDDYFSLLDAGVPMKRGVGFAALSLRDDPGDVSGMRLPFDALGPATVSLVVAQIHGNERGVPERQNAILIEGDWIEGSTLRKKRPAESPG